MLQRISDRRERQQLVRRIDGLAENPDRQGKALREPLAGYRSVRAVGQRYRIIYRVVEDRLVVSVVALGRRKDGDPKDIYLHAARLIKSEKP